MAGRRPDLPDPAADRRAWFYRGFRDYYADRYVRRHFHALRLSRGSAELPAEAVPLVAVANHPAWWDPMTCVLLSRQFGDREHYAVIDAAMLEKYGFFRKLGFFGVDPDSVRGAAAFLRTSQALLAGTRRVLWMTAQGRFADVRERPLGIRSGAGHLAARLSRGFVLPVALEYPFWAERTPEALVRFGTPIDVAEQPGRSARDWTARIEAGLTDTMDALAADAVSRDPGRFRVLVGGSAGVGGVYDGWRRLKAWAAGRRFDPTHTGERTAGDAG